MQNFSKNHPVIFIIILFFVGVLVAGLLGAVTGGYDSDLGTAVGRIIVGVAVFAIFRECFKENKYFSGAKYLLLALILPVWNVVYQAASGMTEIQSGGMIFEVFLCALAPAIFEEVLFRGVFLEKLRENGKTPMVALFISALVFGLVHLTNVVGGEVANTLVQILYAFVIGLFLGAVYLKTRDLATVIIAHFMTDFSTQIFVQNPSQTPPGLIVAFAVVLILLAAWSVWTISKEKEASVPAEVEK